MQIPEAQPLNLIRAASGDNFRSTQVYTLEGKPGLYRHVSRKGSGALLKPSSDDRERAVLNESIAEFVRWDELEILLATKCGLEVLAVDEELEPVVE